MGVAPAASIHEISGTDTPVAQTDETPTPPPDEERDEEERDETPPPDEERDEEEREERDEERRDEERRQDDEEDEQPAEEITISITDGTVEPGNTITLSLTLSDEPVSNATVRVQPPGPNSEKLRTDSSGTVTVIVPNETEVWVEAEAKSEDAFGSKQLLSQERDGREREGERGRDDEREDQERREDERKREEEEQEREQAGGELSIEVTDGTVESGNTITLAITLNGDSVPNATLRVRPPGPNSEEIRTDSDGTATITVPNQSEVRVMARSDAVNAFGFKELLDQDDEETGDEDEHRRDRDESSIAVSIRPPLSPETGVPATFTAVTFGPTSIDSYEWDFDGDGTTDATGQNATYTFESAGDHEVTLTVTGTDGESVTRTATVTVVHPASETEIVDQSVSHLSGPMDTMPTLDVSMSGGLLQVQLQNPNNTWVDNLDGLGVTTETQFEITVTVRNFHPKYLIGEPRDGEWSIEQVGDSTWQITIQGTPETVQFLEGSPSINNWPSEDDQATTVFDPAMSFAVGNTMGAANKGLYIGTDAQAFSSPQFIEGGPDKEASLTIDVAGPHLTVDGEQNQGHYTAVIPDSMLNVWNVTSPDELTAAYAGESKDFEATRVSDGIKISLTFHYSSGTVAIRPQTDSSANESSSANQPPSAAFNISPSTPITDQVIAFNGSTASDPDGSIELYEWDFDGDGTTDAIGKTTTHTFSTSGEHEVSLTVTDGSGVNDTTTQVITVDNASTSEKDSSSPSFQLEATDGSTNPDSTVTVEITFTNPNGTALGSSMTIQVTDYPDTWTIDSHENAGAVYNVDNGNPTWLWITPSDIDSRTPTITFQVPDSTSAGEYDIDIKGESGQGTTITKTATVTVNEPQQESGQDQKQGQSISEAIAGEDGSIDITEIQEAIDYWRNDESVPNTGGKTIDIAKLQELINQWGGSGIL